MVVPCAKGGTGKGSLDVVSCSVGCELPQWEVLRSVHMEDCEQLQPSSCRILQLLPSCRGAAEYVVQELVLWRLLQLWQ